MPKIIKKSKKVSIYECSNCDCTVEYQEGEKPQGAKDVSSGFFGYTIYDCPNCNEKKLTFKGFKEDDRV